MFDEHDGVPILEVGKRIRADLTEGVSIGVGPGSLGTCRSCGTVLTVDGRDLVAGAEVAERDGQARGLGLMLVRQ
jgi:hypothetical protein